MQRLEVSGAVRHIYASLGFKWLKNLKIPYPFDKSPQLVLTRRKIHPVHIRHGFLKIQFNSILPSTPKDSKRPISFISSHQNPFCIRPFLPSNHDVYGHDSKVTSSG